MILTDNELYGTFRNRYFTDIYPNVELFLEDYEHNGIPQLITIDSITTLYYLIYANYGNSIVASSDINRFKYQLFSLIFSYGPTWEKKLEIQAKIRELSDNDLREGTKQINNQAMHPGTAPSTDTLDELPAINQQFVTKYKKDKLSGYSFLWELLNTDVTQSFLNKFKVLFLKIIQPELPLLYKTYRDEEDI